MHKYNISVIDASIIIVSAFLIIEFAIIFLMASDTLRTESPTLVESQDVLLQKIASHLTPEDTIPINSVLLKELSLLRQYNNNYQHFNIEYQKINWAYGSFKLFVSIFAAFLTISVLSIAFLTYSGNQRNEKLAEKNEEEQKNLIEISTRWARKLDEVKVIKEEFKKFQNGYISLQEYVTFKMNIAPQVNKIIADENVNSKGLDISKEAKKVLADFYSKWKEVKVLPIYQKNNQDTFIVGLYLYYKKEYKEAEEFFTKALDEGYKPKADVYSKLSATFDRLGKVDEALKILDKAIKENEVDSSIFYNKGTLLYNKGIKLERQGKEAEAKPFFKDAIRMFDKALEQSPNHIEAKKNKGATYMVLDQPKDAVRVLESIPVYKRNQNTYYNLTVLYTVEKEVKDEEKAFYALEGMLKIKPELITYLPEKVSIGLKAYDAARYDDLITKYKHD